MHKKKNKGYYTGVGSRETPEHICILMQKIAFKLASLGYTGRSGSAEGADMAFETGFLEYGGNNFEAYLPWDGFNRKWVDSIHIDTPRLPAYNKALELMKTAHGKPDKLTKGGIALHTRNVFQVLGQDLQSPSKVLICYSKPTSTGVSGGTNTAWILAQRYGIPCFNLWHELDRYKIKQHLKI